jgi:hypothetical protein
MSSGGDVSAVWHWIGAKHWKAGRIVMVISTRKTRMTKTTVLLVHDKVEEVSFATGRQRQENMVKVAL